MKKAKIVGIVGIIILGLFVALVAAGYYIMNSKQQQSPSETSTSDIPVDISYTIDVNSTGSWKGVVQGSDLTQRSVQGTGFGAQAIKCEIGGVYSAVIQSDGTGQKLIVSFVKNSVPSASYLDNLRDSGQKDKITEDLFRQVAAEHPRVILKQETTTADYGVVTLAGNC